VVLVEPRMVWPLSGEECPLWELSFSCNQLNIGTYMSDSRIIKNYTDFIRSVADLTRGDYKQSEYDKVIVAESAGDAYFNFQNFPYEDTAT
jgi:hypothetical protein